MVVSRKCPKFLSTRYYRKGTGKATDITFGRYIQRVHPNKSLFKILEKRERVRIQFQLHSLLSELVVFGSTNDIRQSCCSRRSWDELQVAAVDRVVGGPCRVFTTADVCCVLAAAAAVQQILQRDDLVRRRCCVCHLMISGNGEMQASLEYYVQYSHRLSFKAHRVLPLFK